VANDFTSSGSSARLSAVESARAAVCHERAGAVRWRVSVERFQAVLEQATSRRFPGGASAPGVEAFLEGLHLEDLALAVGCADGDEEAWEAFSKRYLSEMRRAATAIAGEADGDEIVDALVTDLFARGDGQGGRRSLFEYFHGRSRLGTWLRTLISQRHVDRLRATRRLTPLDDVAESESRWAAAPAPDPDRRRLVDGLHAALDGALQALPARDRLRLAYYHADGLTLAAIGRLLDEHEATVSRKLQRTREAIRAHVDERLSAELGLTRFEMRRCYEYAIEEGGVELDRLRLAEPTRGG
jgi:RNA polymerase sigma-70 factor